MDDQARAATEEHVRRWGLVPDGPAFSTPSSHLAPVVYAGTPAMLKVARVAEERDGARLMAWWAGRGAARVLLHDDAALLLERALGPRSLTSWAEPGSEVPQCREARETRETAAAQAAQAAQAGRHARSRDAEDLAACDDLATRVLCGVARELHTVGTGGQGPPPPGGLVPLERWFTDLLTGAAGHDGFLGRAAATARDLLADQRDVVVLHGDLHHGNVLDFGDDTAARWRAIDPKFLVGDRAFDFTNIVCNPSHAIAAAPGRLERQVSVICAAAGLERGRLLRWIMAWTGLSATWYLSDTWLTPAEHAAAAEAVLGVGQAAEALLARG